MNNAKTPVIELENDADVIRIMKTLMSYKPHIKETSTQKELLCINLFTYSLYKSNKIAFPYCCF